MHIKDKHSSEANEVNTIIPLHSLQEGDHLANPFRLVEMTEFKEGSYDYSRPHRHNYYEVFYFERGGGTHDIDFTTFHIDSPCLHFVSPGQIHQVRRDGDSHGWVILFTDDFYYLNLANRNILHETPFLNRNHPRPILDLNDQTDREILGIIEGLQRELAQDHAYRDDALRALLNLLLITSRRLFESSEEVLPEESNDSRLLREFKRMVEDKFHSMHSVSAYANNLHVTPGHLNDVVKKSTGKTVSTVIQERVLLEAKRLLAHSDYSIKEIAHALGFDDPSYFTRFFRERVGDAPGVFRDGFREGASEG